MAVLNLIRTSQMPIILQLKLEEALLRTSKENWMLINDGAVQPAIVMGISGKPAELIHMEQAVQAGIQVIRRFSGGGTVAIDQDTVFTTLVFQAEQLPHVEAFPAPVMRWTEQLYRPAFEPHGSFALRENDYVFRDRKVGGNAQAITRGRWLHHTSFLWDYAPQRMHLLSNPAKQPMYRQGRDHEQFVSRLKDHVPCRAQLLDGLAAAPQLLGLQVREVGLHQALQHLEREHLSSTKEVDLAAMLAGAAARAAAGASARQQQAAAIAGS